MTVCVAIALQAGDNRAIFGQIVQGCGTVYRTKGVDC